MCFIFWNLLIIRGQGRWFQNLCYKMIKRWALVVFFCVFWCLVSLLHLLNCIYDVVFVDDDSESETEEAVTTNKRPTRERKPVERLSPHERRPIWLVRLQFRARPLSGFRWRSRRAAAHLGSASKPVRRFFQLVTCVTPDCMYSCTHRSILQAFLLSGMVTLRLQT